jgi:FKBP-type peptidyl-prolyl cis-trans isomerase FkpA
MKKQFLLFGLFIVLFSACKKTSYNATTQATIDDHKIQLYIAANHIDSVTKLPSGMYYKILRPDTGARPTDTSTVQVSYTGTFLNGTVFDSEQSTLIDLSGDVVPGFKLGLPLVNTKGRILLIIPSALGYGTAGAGGGTVPIPSNAVLVFEVDLLGFY